MVIALLFGIQLIVMGIFGFAAAFASGDVTGGTRVLLALLGVLSLIIGLYAVRHILITCLRWHCCWASSGSSAARLSCSPRCHTARRKAAAGT